MSATRPRDVFCVIDHLYRDRATADAALEGIFVHNGVRLEIGLDVDWLNDGLVDDEEWRIEWVKFYEGLDLAAAYVETGDERYVNVWCALVEQFCQQVAVGYDPSEVSARRIQNWMYAWQRFGSSEFFPGFSSHFEQVLLDRLVADVTHLRANLTPARNHRTLELYAVFVAVLAFPEKFDNDAAEETLRELANNISTDIWLDGVHCECSTDYHNIVLRSFVGALANARRFALAVDNAYIDALTRACEFSAMMQRPDGAMPSFSDGDVGNFRRLLELAADLLDRDDLRWVASVGQRGVAPRELDATFAVGGYVTQRSGWGNAHTAFRNEKWLMLDCGPIGDGGHGHYDQLSVEMMAGGRSIVVDPGRFTYAENDDGWRHWFKGTAAHNTVTVDGMDQTPYRRGKPKGATSQAKLLERVNTTDVDFITAEVRSPQYGAVHTRRIAFVGREYWIVHDRLRDEHAHDYVLRWHLDADAFGRIAVTRARGCVTIDAPTFQMIFPQHGSAVFVDDGWVSPTYGVKFEAPIVAARATGSEVDFISVIVPKDIGSDVAVETFIGTNCFEATISNTNRSGTVIDRVTWADSPSWQRETAPRS